MADVFPPRNLPGSAENWGRVIEARHLDLETRVTSLAQLLRGDNRNTASSLQVLAGQVSDIAGRLSYSADSPFQESWTSTQPEFDPWGPTLSFSVDERRVVSLSFVVAGTASISSLGGFGAGYSDITPCLFLDGLPVGGDQPGLNVSLPGGDNVRGTTISSPLQARTVITVDPGDHDFQGGFRFREVVQSSGSGVIGIVGAQNPKLFVDVNQLG